MSVTCEHCGSEFTAKRSTARFCSQRCQKRAKAGKPAPAPAVDADEVDDPDDEGGVAQTIVTIALGLEVINATRRDLVAANKLDTVAGRQAMVVAARLTLPSTSGSEVSSLSKELSRLMALVVGKGGENSDPVDQVKQKRDEKIAKAREAAG